MDEEIKKRGPGRPRNQGIAPPPMDTDWRASADTMRGDMRPDDVRHDLRDSDPQEAARIRAAQIMAQLGDSLGEEDKFDVPEELKAPGWDVEWKKWSVYNAEDHGYISGLQRTGWEFVPAKRPGFERFIPRNWKENFILKDGMVLMERPKEVTDIIKSRQLGQAKERVKIAERQHGHMPRGGLGTPDNNGMPISSRGVTGARRTIVGAIPD